MRIFVAHDFGHPPIRRYRDAFERIAKAHTVHFTFGDSIHAADHLLEQIEKMIVEADACLFDVSTANRNVFLELGYARGRDKPHYLLFRRRSKVLERLGFVDGVPPLPSDIQGQRLKFYSSWQSLFGQLSTIVSELLTKADLSGHQDLLEARVEDLLARHPGGLLIGQISTEIKLEQALVYAILKVLIERRRVAAQGNSSARRYRKADLPLEAAE